MHIGKTDFKENENMLSSDFKIIEYLKSSGQNNKNLSIFWNENGLPKVIKIYDTNYFYGKNWVGVLEKKIGKVVLSSNQTLIWDTLKQIDFKNEVTGYGELFNN